MVRYADEDVERGSKPGLLAEGDCGLCTWFERYECVRLRGGLEGLEAPGDC